MHDHDEHADHGHEAALSGTPLQGRSLWLLVLLGVSLLLNGWLLLARDRRREGERP